MRLERDKEHQRYYLGDGTQVSGASKIAKMGDSTEGIIHWAWKLGTQGVDYKRVRNQAADAGHIAHFMVDCHLRGADPDLREFSEAEVESAQPSFGKFLDFWAKERLTMLAIETQMVHEELKYGGTTDLVALDEDMRVVLIDWKSSKALYNGHKWQLGGYETLWNFNRPEHAIQRRAIVRIGRDPADRFQAHWIPDEKAERHRRVFAAQAALYNIINESKYGKK